MRENVLDRHPDAKLRVYVVWVPRIPTDERFQVADLIVDDRGRVWVLEVNVAPGFTETSTVPLSIQAAGLDLGKVCASLVQAAAARSPQE